MKKYCDRSTFRRTLLQQYLVQTAKTGSKEEIDNEKKTIRVNL